MKTSFTCFVACQLALLHSAFALPVASRGAPGKNLLLWDYTNTNSGGATSGAISAAAPSVQAVSNWNTWRPTDAPDTLAFYPQVRTMAQLEGNDWTMLIASIETEVAAGRVPTVQYLNEPEYLGVSAGDAAAAWISKMLPLKATYGATLVGPATSSSDSGIAFQKEFMAALAENQKPDYVGIHYYTTDGQAVDTELAWGKSYLSEAHSTYNRPLFVSEVASTSRDAAQVKEFSDSFKTWMDSQDYIAQYGFFGATLQPVNGFVSPEAQLLNSAGQWTALGAELLGL